MSTQPLNAPIRTGAPSPWATNAEGSLNGTPKSSGYQLPLAEVSKEQDRILIGFTCMFLVLCLACVVGRLVARHKVRLSLEADDYLAVVALISFIALAIEQILIAIHNDHPSLSLGKLEFASQFTYGFLITTARASILMLYRRIFSLRVLWFRIAWWINAVLVITYFAALLAGLLHQCGPKPISTLWRSIAICTQPLRGTSGPAIMGFLNAILDTLILVLPIRMVWRLQMSFKQKFGVSAIFALGSIGVLTSIARAVTVINFRNVAAISFMIWSIAEAAVALMCACLPILRPLFTGCFVRSSSRIQKKGTRTSMTFPTIAISESCKDGSQTEDKASQSSFRQDVESVYHKEDMKAAVMVKEHAGEEM